MQNTRLQHLEIELVHWWYCRPIHIITRFQNTWHGCNIDVATWPWPSWTTIDAEHSLHTSENSLYLAKIMHIIGAGMCVKRMQQSNPQYCKLTKCFEWMQHGYGNMWLTIYGNNYRSTNPRSIQEQPRLLCKTLGQGTLRWNGYTEGITGPSTSPQGYKTLWMDATWI